MFKNSISFNISERKILLRLIDICIVLIVLYGLGAYFKFDYFTISNENWSWVIVLILYLTIFGTVFEIYDLQKSSVFQSTLPNVFLTAMVVVAVYLMTPRFTPFLPEKRIQILVFFLGILGSILFWRAIYITCISTPRFYKHVLLVGEPQHIDDIVTSLKQVDPHYNIVGFINCEPSNPIHPTLTQSYNAADLNALIAKHKVSEILVATYNSELITTELYQELMRLLERGFPIKEYTQAFEEMTYRIPVHYLGKDFYKYFPFNRNNQNKLYLLQRWIFDKGFGVCCLLVCLLIIPVVLLGNAIGNRGPLFYKQQRVGLHGKLFSIIKFRSMVVNAEQHGAVWASKNDARITAFGKFLRLTRIDEIPQCLNVLKGEMSLIGPRPERPEFVKQLAEVIPFYEARHMVKPGITGWAQVKVRYGDSVEDSLMKLQYDLFYIKKRSFFLDLNILVKTVTAVVFFRGQ
ncbi:sugar transferase [Formosa sediminum]|uniref:Sugar transferase n=1 Tax=Formosa sediminum TaxID=2594004 RepID=A0A516GRN9_9FLAO|nr:sugar transferase [Formosa sediminum]QDO94192.1 sugar transferase [Formosa sediminum]